MNIRDCIEGLQVTHKGTNKPATVQYADLGKGEVEIAFENGTMARVRPADLDPVMAGERPPKPAGPSRPCPNCAQPIPYKVTTCPACGFQYGVAKAGGGGKTIVVIIVLAAIAYAIWKFVLHR